MEEQKYRFIGEDGEFENDEILTVVEDVNNTSKCKLYSNGEVEEWLYSEHSPDVEPIRNFEVGSKWITKCDISSSRYNTDVTTIEKGVVLRVVKVFEEKSLVEFNSSRYLTLGEAELLLEPYIEKVKEMTLDDIENALGHKIELKITLEEVAEIYKVDTKGCEVSLVVRPK